MCRRKHNPMERFRLKSPTMAVSHHGDDSKGVAVVIPSGSEVICFESTAFNAQLDHSRFVSVKWAGRMVNMFILDLVERGERINAANQ
jgi:hypothetical protein